MSPVSRETTPFFQLPEDKILESGANDLSIDLSVEIITVLLQYLELLRRWNKKIQLIGPAKPAEEVVLHLIDSLAGLRFLDQDQGRFLDLGSGAGLPGIPLAICRPDWKFTLVESRDKKAAFIRNAVRSLGLDNVDVRSIRAGAKGDGLDKKGFDLVSARALGSLKDIFFIARPYIAPSGGFLAYKGPGVDEELFEAEPSLGSLALKLVSRINYQLPFINRSRSLLLFK